MELNWFCFTFVILCVYVNHSSEESGLPQSPCPNMFEYAHDGKKWIGTVQVQGSPLGQTTKLEVMLSLRAQLPSQYVGSVELYGTRSAAEQEIRSGQPVRYRIHFPLQNPLPKLTQISVNGQVFCTGPPDTGAYVTSIRLDYSLHTEVSGQFGNTTRPTAQPHSKSPPAQPHSESPPAQPYSKSPPGQPHYKSPQNTSEPTGYGSDEKCGILHPKYNFSTSVDGVTVLRGSWPWLAAIYLNKAAGPSFKCGGTVVSSKTVVTAAHCFRTPERQYAFFEVIIFLGRYNILDWNEIGVKAAQVEQIIIHSDYMSKDTSFDADIAIAIMRDSVHYSEYIRPICLWEGPYGNGPESVEGTVISWGRDDNGNVLTPLLKKVTIPIISEADCLGSCDAYRYVTSVRTFCAYKNNGLRESSGAPMAFERNGQWMLRGIVSAAVDPIGNTCNEHALFTDAVKFVSWIRSYMR